MDLHSMPGTSESWVLLIHLFHTYVAFLRIVLEIYFDGAVLGRKRFYRSILVIQENN